MGDEEMQVRENKKVRMADQEFISNVRNTDLSRNLLERLYAKDKQFVNVSFRQSVLSECYFRRCSFVQCDFVGAKMYGCNLDGATFDGCTFSYSNWEKTLLEENFLDTCLPSEENLARDLVRSLRVNFAQIGNYVGVNRAASLEVRLTGKHLYNAAFSRQSYYRQKYRGWSRVWHAIRWSGWKVLDLLWGNGESIIRVLVSGLVFVGLVAVWYTQISPSHTYSAAYLESLAHFFGVEYRAVMPPFFAGLLMALRFLLFGLFMAILVKRLSRR